MVKPTKWHVRPANTQIRLGGAWASEQSDLSSPSLWRNLVSLATHWAHNEDWSDWADAQTDRSLRWATCHFVWLSCSGSFFVRECEQSGWLVGWLCWGLTSQSTIFQSCRDGATASWVINQYFRGVKCLAQGHNTAAVGFEPPTSRSGVRHSTTEQSGKTCHNLLKIKIWFFFFFFFTFIDWWSQLAELKFHEALLVEF